MALFATEARARTDARSFRLLSMSKCIRFIWSRTTSCISWLLMPPAATAGYGNICYSLLFSPTPGRRLSRFHCRLAAVDELEPRLLLLQQGNLSQRAVLDSSDAWNHVGDLRALNADMQQLMSWNFALPYSSVEISLRVPIFGVFPTSPTRSITSVPPIQRRSRLPWRP